MGAEAFAKVADFQYGRVFLHGSDLPIRSGHGDGALAVRLGTEDGVGVAAVHPAFNQPQNALFHEKSNRLLIKKLSPVLAQIISEGMESGLFDTPYPAETAELILVGITGFVDSKDSPADEDSMNHRMESFLYNAARMLGMSQSGLDGFKKLFLSK